MKIVQVIAGSGDSFYCENCLRDLSLVRAMRARGHEVLGVPLYLPPLGDEPARHGLGPIFFGGINVFLQQKLALFRRTPRFIDRLLDTGPLLRLASRMAGMTSPDELAATTISMLRGPLGRQAKELDRLVRHLRNVERPDAIILANALLLGMAGPLRSELGCRVVCLLQDEDEFVDALPPSLAADVWKEIAARAADCEAFAASSRYYAGFMAGRLSLPRQRVRVVLPAVEPPSSPPVGAATGPNIGFLSRFCEGKGLDLLAQAFVELRKKALGQLRLLAAGGKTSADEAFIARVRGVLADGAADTADLRPNLRDGDRWPFLAGLTVLAAPSRRPEAAGLCALEALAVGVPVVVPDCGALAEIVADTGGGITFKSGDAESLTAALGRMLSDLPAAAAMGRAGQAVVRERFSPQRAAEALEAICVE